MLTERIQLAEQEALPQEVVLPQKELKAENARLIGSLFGGIENAPQFKAAVAKKFLGPIKSDESPYVVGFDIKGFRHEVQNILTATLHSVRATIKDNESIRDLRMDICNSNGQEPTSCEIVFKETKKDGTISTITNTEKAVRMGSEIIKEFVQAANTPYAAHT